MTAAEEESWFVHLDTGDKGPFTPSEMRQLLDSGELTPNDYAWCEGMQDWQQISAIPKLAAVPAAAAAASPASRMDRKRRIALAVAGMLVLAGSAFALSRSQGFGAFCRNHFPSLVKKFPLKRFVHPPLAAMSDVSQEDYALLEAAALAPPGSDRPPAVAVSRDHPEESVVYVASNEAEGTRLELWVKGKSATLVGSTEYSATLTSPVKQHLATFRLVDESHKRVPEGRYELRVIESKGPKGRVLLSTELFLGGSDDAAYKKSLEAFHSDLVQRANDEINELAQLQGLLRAQIGEVPVSRNASEERKKSWASVSASIDTMLARHMKSFGHELRYPDLFKLAQDAKNASDVAIQWQDVPFAAKAQVDRKTADEQTARAVSYASSALDQLKTRVERLENAPPSPDGLPPSDSP